MRQLNNIRIDAAMSLYKTYVKKIPISADKKTKQKDYLSQGALPIIDQGHVLIGGYTDDISKQIPCNLPVIVFGDHTKVVKYINFPFGAGADGIKILEPKEDVNPLYLYFRTIYLTYKIKDKGYARHYQYIEKVEVSIPPFEEQERIVARIEELFSELDKAAETLKTTKEQLGVYRQAVLKEAFEGITEKVSIRNLTCLVTSGSRGWAKYYSDHGARFIRITDLTRDKIYLKNDNIQYVDLPSNAEGKRSLLLKNDVLVSITADLGSIALVPSNVGEAYINQHIAMIRFKNAEQGEYMAWYLKSDLGQKDLLRNKRGGGKLGLGLDDIRDTPVPVVSDENALKTVQEIESRLSVCDSIEKTVDTALQQADAMRQSILKQAFEGRLL
jgi:type I restriction enzyme S subunit